MAPAEEEGPPELFVSTLLLPIAWYCFVHGAVRSVGRKENGGPEDGNVTMFGYTDDIRGERRVA